MIRLINGRGQLGFALRKHVDSFKTEKSACIYHTWHIDDKSLVTQKAEYKKFVDFVHEHRLKEKIFFISTTSIKDNWYNTYKQLAEAHLLANTTDGVIIRLPTLIGKGVFEGLKTGELDPTGYFNLMSIDEATERIVQNITELLCGGKRRVVRIEGEKVSARNVLHLIKFGQRP